MLEGFHVAKCVVHCIGKYIRGSELDDTLLESNVLEIKLLESVLSGSNYATASQDM